MYVCTYACMYMYSAMCVPIPVVLICDMTFLSTGCSGCATTALLPTTETKI